VHTETFWLGRQKRDAQVDALIESTDTSHPFIIVGGDFNTLTPASAKELEESFSEVGMERATKDIEYTVKYPPLEFTLDHIFTKGMDVIDAGKSDKAEASDHLPIWAKLMPRDEVQP
jgi:endonuclease/exonuclease/phosphatase (EEP) superfamily protein YafD